MSTSEIEDPSPKHADAGAVCARWVRCGKSWCRCAHGGPKHGPYFARYRREGGRRQKECVRLPEAPERRAACDERRQVERAARAQAEAARQDWRHIRDLIRRVERGEA